MQALDRPVVGHERRCEVVEQLGMRGRGGPHPEIAGRLNERLPEMMHPNAVDEYARGERIVSRGDRSSQIQATAAVSERQLVITGQNPQELSRHRLTRL